jgi:hypothetical protein
MTIDIGPSILQRWFTYKKVLVLSTIVWDVRSLANIRFITTTLSFVIVNCSMFKSLDFGKPHSTNNERLGQTISVCVMACLAKKRFVKPLN